MHRRTLTLAVLLALVPTGCRREERAPIRRDDEPGLARRPRDAAPTPTIRAPASAPSPSWDEHDGEIVLSFELDRDGHATHRGEPLTLAEVAALVRAAKDAGTVRAEIATDPKTGYAAVLALIDAVTKAGARGVSLKSTSGGPVALTIGSGASLTIGGPADAGSD